MNFRERKVTSEDSLPFIKLQDGESVIGLFAGDPYEFYQHWEGNRSVICPGKATCAKCQAGDKELPLPAQSHRPRRPGPGREGL